MQCNAGQTAPPPGTQILAHHAVNPEVMAEMSGPTPLLLRATAAEDAEGVVIDRMDTVTTIRWNVWMEVHLRLALPSPHPHPPVAC